MNRYRLVLAATLFVAGLLSHASYAASTSGITIQASVRGQQLEGTPLFASPRQVMLLSRDGRMFDFSPGEARDYKQSGSRFQPFTPAEMRSAMEREFGGELEITATGHFLVAHPRKQGGQWAGRFEELYRSFAHYFSVRGFKLEEPKFPLVAIVWQKREDFLRYAAADGGSLPPGVLGYYSPKTNRITLYDLGAGKATGADWSENFSTVIHEATHQSAFNTGIHNRFAQPPKWVIEGLGTLFEAPAIWDSRNPRQRDRVNRGRLSDFKRRLSAGGRQPMAFVDLIESDRQFASDALSAYAESWAFTYFLVETDSRRYCQYLAKTAARPNFSDYPAAQRLADFKSVFGDNFRMLEANYLRFLEQVK